MFALLCAFPFEVLCSSCRERERALTQRSSSHCRFTFTTKTSESPRRTSLYNGSRAFRVCFRVRYPQDCSHSLRRHDPHLRRDVSLRSILGVTISHYIAVGPPVPHLSLKQTWSPPGGQAVAGDVRHTCCARVDRRPREEPPSCSSLQQATAS